MISDEVVHADEGDAPFVNPWPALGTGLGVIVLTTLLSGVLGKALLLLPLLITGLAVLAVAAGVWIRPRSPAVLGAAAVAALLASVAVSPRQGVSEAAVTVATDLNGQEHSGLDSHAAQLLALKSTSILFRVMAVIGAVAALLMLAPQPVRRVVVVLLILFHFGGIFTAVTSASPQPWLTGQIWTYIYRPYLYFMYLNNAYHFYSPEPGPASLLWFRIEYEKDENGTKHWRWVKVPHLDENGNSVPWLPKVEYTRRLSLAESANQPASIIPDPIFQQLLNRRFVAGRDKGIPLHPELPPNFQYREPNNFSKHWIAAYARHVARSYPHAEDKPHLTVTGVKVYRVVHRILGAHEVANRTEMSDITTYMPFYQGEFDKDGNMKEYQDANVKGAGKPPIAQDPFLYWLIPIVRVPSDQTKPVETPFPFRVVPIQPLSSGDQQNTVLKDYLKIHAGDLEGEN